MLAWWAKLSPARLTSHLAVLIGVPAAVLPKQLPMSVPRRTADDGPSM